MKKVLALVLASIMVMAMGVTAFAATSDLSLDDDSTDVGAYDSSKIYVPIRDSVDSDNVEGSMDDAKVTVKVTEGKEYVKSTKLDDLPAGLGYGVVISLQDYYQVDKITIKLEVKLVNKNGRELDKMTVTYRIDNTANATILADSNISTAGIKWNASNKEVTVKYPGFTGNIINFGKAEFIELEADFFGFAVKASEQGKLPMDFDNKVVKSIAKLAPADAEMTFFNFNGRPSFDFTGKATIVLPDEDKEYYLYSIDEDGNLAAVAGAQLNDDGDAVEFKTRTLGSYVLSDMALESEEEDLVEPEEPTTPGTPTNPDKLNPPTGFGVAATVAALAF